MKLMKSVAIGNSDERTRPRGTGILPVGDADSRKSAGETPTGPTNKLSVPRFPK